MTEEELVRNLRSLRIDVNWDEDSERRFIDDFHRRLAAEETPTRTNSGTNRRSRGIVATLNSSQNRNRRSNLSTTLEGASGGETTPRLTRGQRNGNMNRTVRGARLVRMIRRVLGRR